MKKFPLDEYRRIREKDISELKKCVASLNELKYVLNERWFLRLKKVLYDFDDNLSFNDGAYDLFRILSNEFSVEVLEERLINIACLAENQGKLKSYRKTRKELGSTQTNQVFGSLFEVNILSGIIRSCASVDLFPPTGSGGQDVEGKLIIDGRAIFVEAKAFGYSNYDPVDCVGVHSIDSMQRQIFDGLNSKLSEGQQLFELSSKDPTVLLLSLGFNADSHCCSWAIESYYEECRSNISLILVFGSALCRGKMKAFRNNKSSFPLSENEQLYFEKDFLNSVQFNRLSNKALEPTAKRYS